MNALDPICFTDFCTKVVHVDLTPAQYVLSRVAFDRTHPADLPADQRVIARKIFGDVDHVPDVAWEVVVAVCGARAGKSYVFCALRLLHLALTVPLDTLAAGEQAAGIVVCPDLRLSRQTFRYITGAIRSVPSIARLVTGETTESITLARPDGHAVELVCLPATRGGAATRGRSLVGCAADEIAFFRGEDFQVNDRETFKSVAPRILPGGQVILASTPWIESGLLFDMFEANHGHPTTGLACHAPTEVLRPDARTRGIVARERERDPENAMREFDAIPMSAGAGMFFDAAAIRAAVVEAA